jgi:ribulose-phosphate 3-epimerase
MLSSDFSKLAEEAERMVDCGADYLHMDIMDGYFLIFYFSVVLYQI